MYVLRTFRFVLLALAVLAVAGLILPLILKSRVNSDRVNCQNHLREIGLVGLRHASLPGEGLPTRPRDELPPGTIVNLELIPDQRLSWYMYLLNAMNDGIATPDAKGKHRQPLGMSDAMKDVKLLEVWDAPANASLRTYRFKLGICPAQVPQFVDGEAVSTNYVAVGGVGFETPGLSLAAAGLNGGAFRYDGPTPNSAFADGLHETAQIIETNASLAPWLQGGPATLRVFDPLAAPHLGKDRSFGGCHPGGCYISMADGSVQFVKDSVHPNVLRSMFTRSGGNEMPSELP